ncbi:MAG: hypothetical protein ACRDRT_00375 [Pseudonocardiaceae bacterium]
MTTGALDILSARHPSGFVSGRSPCGVLARDLTDAVRREWAHHDSVAKVDHHDLVGVPPRTGFGRD